MELDSRIRVERALADLAENAKRTDEKRTLGDPRRPRSRFGGRVRDAARERQVAVEEAVRSTLADFASTDVQELNDDSLVDLRGTLERRILEVQERSTSFLRYVRGQLQSIDLSGELGLLRPDGGIGATNVRAGGAF